MAGARKGVVLLPRVWTSWVIMGSRSMEHVGETELPDPLVLLSHRGLLLLSNRGGISDRQTHAFQVVR